MSVTKVAVDAFFSTEPKKKTRRNRFPAVSRPPFAPNTAGPPNHTKLTGLSFAERRHLEASASHAMQPHSQQHGVRPDIQPSASPVGITNPNVIAVPACPGASASAGSGRRGGEELGSPRLLEGGAGSAHWDAGSADTRSDQEQVGRQGCCRVCVLWSTWSVPQPAPGGWPPWSLSSPLRAKGTRPSTSKHFCQKSVAEMVGRFNPLAACVLFSAEEESDILRFWRRVVHLGVRTPRSYETVPFLRTRQQRCIQT